MMKVQRKMGGERDGAAVRGNSIMKEVRIHSPTEAAMPVYINDKDIFEKLVRVEGEQYRKEGNDNHQCSFRAFLATWESCVAAQPRFATLRPEFPLSIRSNTMIYGTGGLNRYGVLNTGEVMLIKASIKPTLVAYYMARARLEGFRVFPDDFP
jgi:hypothetical protein